MTAYSESEGTRKEAIVVYFQCAVPDLLWRDWGKLWYISAKTAGEATTGFKHLEAAARTK